MPRKSGKRKRRGETLGQNLEELWTWREKEQPGEETKLSLLNIWKENQESAGREKRVRKEWGSHGHWS